MPTVTLTPVGWKTPVVLVDNTPPPPPPPGTPGAPTLRAATAGDGLTALWWTSPTSVGGSPISGYVITPTPSVAGGPFTVGNVTQAIMSGFTNGTPYTLSVQAINAAGAGTASVSSVSVTPAHGQSAQPGPNSVGAPAIPDGVWPMGYQGFVKGQPQALIDLFRDWNFTTDGPDISGYRIHGKVVCRENNISGDGWEIIGSDTGTTANALLDFDTHFTGTPPNLKNGSIIAAVPVQGTNGWQGDEATLTNIEIANVGGDALSPNNEHNGLLPLNATVTWFYFHDLVYYITDSGHTNGTHNDGMEINGGTNLKLSRGYITGLCHPTLGDGAKLRTTGPNDGTGPRPLGQQNSAVITIQGVSPVGSIVVDQCRLGGGWYGTANIQSVGSTHAVTFTISNSIFEGNCWGGNDVVIHSNTNVTLTNNVRADGKPLVVHHDPNPS